jgi:hypothetical protein
MALIYIGQLEDNTYKEDIQVFLRDNAKYKISNAKNHGQKAYTSHLRLETHLTKRIWPMTLAYTQQELPYDLSTFQEMRLKPETPKQNKLSYCHGIQNWTGTYNLTPENEYTHWDLCNRTALYRRLLWPHSFRKTEKKTNTDKYPASPSWLSPLKHLK